MFPVFRSLPFVMADDTEPCAFRSPRLDLHTFRPTEVASLVDEYLAACCERV